MAPKLTKSAKARILAQRSTITTSHDDRVISTSSDCGDYHVDSGIGVEFPDR
jgi:hypothetical protein